MRTILLLCTLFFVGCATVTTPDVPTETNIPVGIPCLTQEQIPKKPDFVTDAQLIVKPDEQLVLSLASDRLARQDYERKLEAQLFGCVGKQNIPDGIVAPKDVTPSKPWWKFW